MAKPKRHVELTKDNRKVIVSLLDGDLITSCITDPEMLQKSSCEVCKGDDKLCQDYIDFLHGQGYDVQEVSDEDLENPEVSLPKFIEGRAIAVPEVAVEGDTGNEDSAES